MSYTGSQLSCDLYLNKILESCKRVGVILEKHNQQSISLYPPPSDLTLSTPKLSYYRDYAKKKIDRICGDFESALKFVIEHPELYTANERQEKQRNLDNLKEFEKQDESDTTPKNDSNLKSLKRTSSERPERKNKRTHLVPSNKYKLMKEYYKNVIKPNYSPKPRKGLITKKS